MRKQEFLGRLRRKLKGLPKQEINERISFYSEMIDDRMEEGLSEEEAVDKIGTTDDISRQILADCDMPNTKKSKGSRKSVLLLIGSPIWFSLIVVAAAIAVSLLASLWAVVISLWSVFVALAASGAAGAVAVIPFAIFNSPTVGFAILGAALVCVGLSIFAFLGCRVATRGADLLTRCTVRAVKKCFGKTEETR